MMSIKFDRLSSLKHAERIEAYRPRVLGSCFAKDMQKCENEGNLGRSTVSEN